MLRAIPLILLAAAAPAVAQQASSAIAGSVDGGVYTSPTGAFKIEIPVLPALGGEVHDTSTVVTFRDSFGLQISVGLHPRRHPALGTVDAGDKGLPDLFLR
jgi:hypothetical protein